jgi:lysophospholipase L1-like esterase
VKLAGALDKMTNGTIKIEGFEAIILFLGTNNLGERPMAIARQMCEIVRFLQRTEPNMKIGICRIIPRPGDPRTRIEGDRTKVNELYKAMCKRNGLAFLDSYKGVCTHGAYDQTLYANDLIHLNWQGILRMREYMTGAAATMLERH